MIKPPHHKRMLWGGAARRADQSLALPHFAAATPALPPQPSPPPQEYIIHCHTH